MEEKQVPSPQQKKEGTNFIGTCVNGVNALSGVGILSIPFALYQGGWFSLIILFIMAMTCWYTGLLLQRCMIVNPHIKTYPDIGGLAFGTKGRILVSIFVYLELYLLAVEFLILEGDNFQKLFPDLGFNIGKLRIEGRHLFVPLTGVLILPTTWLKNLGSLAYVAFFGVVASTILVCCVIWVGAVDGVGFHQKGVLLKFEGLPTTTSLFVFCYCAHAVFPMLCDSMKDKTQFPKVQIVCFAISTINYGSMAILGYLMYGGNIESQITLNLPIKKTSTKIALYTTLINPLTKYAAMTNPISTAVEDACHFSFNLCGIHMISIIVRTLLVISTVVMALVIPFFAYVMAFTGAFLSIAVSIIIPCLCYLKINTAARKFGWELIVIISILVIGFCIGVVGTYSSLREIVKHL